MLYYDCRITIATVRYETDLIYCEGFLKKNFLYSAELNYIYI